MVGEWSRHVNFNDFSCPSLLSDESGLGAVVLVLGFSSLLVRPSRLRLVRVGAQAAKRLHKWGDEVGC